MTKNVDKEHIIQTIIATSKELDINILNQFETEMKNMNDEIKNNPAAYAILAASIAQSNSIKIMTEVLYKILNE